MTFSVQAKVQDVSEQTEGDLGPVDVLCQIVADDDSAIVGGEFRFQMRPNRGLQIPSSGDRVSVNGWFSYDDGSRAGSTTPS